MKLTFLWENWFNFFPTQRKWSMAFKIFFLSYTWQSVGFLFQVIHYGCFFCPCVREFSLNDCAPGELNFNPLCVSVDTGRTLWPACAERRLLYLFKPALPGCCHAAAIWKRKIHSHNSKHAQNLHFSPLNNSVHVTVGTFLVLNHLPLLPSLFTWHLYF